MKTIINIIWFRRDLRLHDNVALYQALTNNKPVLPIFIFDKNILDDLEDKSDRRVQFIYSALQEIQQQLITAESSLEVYYDFPQQVFKNLLSKYTIENVFTNHDYEQYAIDRDNEVAQLLRSEGASFHTYKDQVIFEKEEIIKEDGNPYTVFTPYSRKWKAKFNALNVTSFPTEKYFHNFYKQPSQEISTLAAIGFKETMQSFPGKHIRDELLQTYEQNRNYPSVPGTSRLGVHLRFGTISIRELTAKAALLSESFLNELIWRDFYHAILWHFPQVRAGRSFKPQYDLICWRNNEEEFIKWCDGKTGYPIVDAGMRELNATGFMHNRVRMITASFLTKHLLIDWRWGEAYFAKKLLDFDYAANSGGWQWAAGSGCDAAPYFRIFNPALQTEKFDKDLKYILQWVPELNSFDYPKSLLSHETARKRCLEVYGVVLKK